MSAFTEKDKDLFFGREEFVEQLVEAVKQHPLVPVIGASGSGKSSVVFAGLIPRLRAEGTWLIQFFRPQSQPFYGLASALVRLLKPELDEIQQPGRAAELAGEMNQGKLMLSQVVASILERNPGKRILLVIDQFEELYKPDVKEEDQHNFLDQILNAIKEQHNCNFTLLLTLRADFIPLALLYQPFGEAWSNAKHKWLLSMNRQELEAVIEKPVEGKVKIAAKLTERILNAVEGKAGNLPLLEFALTELWLKQVDYELTHQVYEEIGGVENALAEHAQKQYDALNQTEQLKAKQIFIQLVYPGQGTEDTRRLATRSEVGTDNWNVVAKLADARLVVTGSRTLETTPTADFQESNSASEETVEVIHETLITKWNILKDWIDGDRIFRTWQERLRTNMRQWIISTKDKGALLRGFTLREAQNKFQERRIYLSHDEQEYIEISWQVHQEEEAKRQEEEFEKRILSEANQTLTEAKQKAETQLTEAEKQKKQIIGSGLSGLAVIILLASAVVGAAWKGLTEAQKGTQLEQAGVNAWFQFKSGELSSLVSAMQSTQDLQNLIGNGRDIKDYPAVSPILALQKILDDIHEQNYFEAGQGEVKSAVFLPGDKGLITAGEGKENKEDTLQMWNLAGKKELSLKGLKGDLLSGVNAVSVGGNAQNPVIASAGEDGTVRLWNKSGQQIKLLVAEGKPNYDSFTAIAVSPDGQKIIAGKGNGTVYLWDNKSGRQLKTWAAHGNKVTAISFSKNGQTLATAGNDGLARIWTITGNKLGELKHPQIKKMLGVSLSPDGQFVATASDDNRARIWTVNGQEVRRLEGHQGWVMVVNFSPDGKSVATGSDDGSVKLWNSKTGQQIQDFRGHRGVVLTASFSPDGKRLVSAGRDGFVRLWNLADKPLQRLELTGFKDDVNAIAFSPDGKTIAGAGDEGVMRQWDATSGKEMKVWKEAIVENRKVQDIAFSPDIKDGKFIVAGGETNTARAWDLAGSLTKPQAELGGNEEKQELDQIGIASVAVSPKSQLIATGSYDKTMRIWKPKSPNGELVAMIPKQEGVVSRVVFTSDGKRIVTADWDGNVAMWDLAGKQISKWQKVHKNQIRGLGITQDGNRIVTADKSGNVKILDSSGKPQGDVKILDSSGKPKKEFFKKEFFSYQNGINQLILSPNDKLIATAGMDGTVRLWDFQGRQVAEFRNPKGAIWGVAFSPDSQQISLAGDRGFVSVHVIESLPSLMQKGCGWLQDYLKSHPGEKDTLKVCQ
ncbi:AAA family ATPase [Microcoleus sp. PH2017_30_WIL_O_A]|uniref:NACHT and WD repeat domain-containing protein n=1 Tax=Microcoleus sp. PH2017_30_WIL_O_A TaxID=2798840 RepID=UPI001D6B78D1|nr:AAA family ATPase [Microcoleus sp. PH2017_30_WIL_O_A]MCC3582630.1 PD40 domain-containing protein [Microcoleus sp. PH2017_30_WIL_O_A]